MIASISTFFKLHLSNQDFQYKYTKIVWIFFLHYLNHE